MADSGTPNPVASSSSLHLSYILLCHWQLSETSLFEIGIAPYLHEPLETEDI